MVIADTHQAFVYVIIDGLSVEHLLTRSAIIFESSLNNYPFFKR